MTAALQASAKAVSPSSTPRQRQIKPRAASSLGPAGHTGLALHVAARRELRGVAQSLEQVVARLG